MYWVKKAFGFVMASSEEEGKNIKVSIRSLLSICGFSKPESENYLAKVLSFLKGEIKIEDAERQLLCREDLDGWEELWDFVMKELIKG